MQLFQIHGMLGGNQGEHVRINRSHYSEAPAKHGSKKAANMRTVYALSEPCLVQLRFLPCLGVVMVEHCDHYWTERVHPFVCELGERRTYRGLYLMPSRPQLGPIRLRSSSVFSHLPCLPHPPHSKHSGCSLPFSNSSIQTPTLSSFFSTLFSTSSSLFHHVKYPHSPVGTRLTASGRGRGGSRTRCTVAQSGEPCDHKRCLPVGGTNSGYSAIPCPAAWHVCWRRQFNSLRPNLYKPISHLSQLLL